MQYLGKYSSTVKQLAHWGWRRVNRQEELRLEEGEDMRDGRAEELSAIGDGGPAVISLTPDADGLHIRSFESSQLEGSRVGYCNTVYPNFEYQF